jgi:ADP-ribose pyrophosphatase YjhB (NUDIX family)
MPRRFDYCPRCAAPFSFCIINDGERMVCPSCNFIFWQNPVVGVAIIVMESDHIILGRRARGEHQGAWCIPCGYVEYDEDVRHAAQREFQEETGLLVDVGEVYTVHSNFHNPAMHSVGIWFRGTVIGGTLQAADDVDAVAYVALNALPAKLAFPTDRRVLDQLQRDIYGTP